MRSRLETAPETPVGAAPYYDIVGLAASAGGLAAFTTVISLMKSSFAAPILVLQHLEPGRDSALVDILKRRTEMAVVQAVSGDLIRPGTIYVGPPDYHLLVSPGGKILLSSALPVEYARPSANLFFTSLAEVYGSRAVAVILSGMGHDGSLGIQAVRQQGGYVIAQDEASSTHFSMPGSAIQTGFVNRVLPAAKIARALEKLVLGGEMK